ncbi:hypothetical protein [Salinivibrio costicola]|uniref:hypothetical protein n=1 Tax=Salinivibrio costicola TaxID=51367 RepID=UPI00253FC1D5|nr:hypothetical protein [Salinivibrio costicola]
MVYSVVNELSISQGMSVSCSSSRKNRVAQRLHLYVFLCILLFIPALYSFAVEMGSEPFLKLLMAGQTVVLHPRKRFDYCLVIRLTRLVAHIPGGFMHPPVISPEASAAGSEKAQYACLFQERWLDMIGN